MAAADIVKSSDCPDCGASLSQGVCPACALDILNVPVKVPKVETKGIDLDMDFGRYKLKQKLASGGMGVVYLAEDLQLKRKVALKMIRGSTFANASERARFTVESEAVAALDHPNIVPIHEVGVIEEQPFFTMKLIEGRSLSDCFRGGDVSVRQLVEWLKQIALAVQHAHQRGVLHRDLKPGNVLVDEGGNAWLMDFGLAKVQGEESGLTRSSDHLGTPHYMSPEAVNGGGGDVSTASDVWSLGVMLWEAIVGQLPFSGSAAVEIMQKIVTDEPERAEVTGDRDLITLARRCLEKDPARRIATAGAFVEELDRWLRGEPLRVRRITAFERCVKWVRRKPAIAALYLVLACGVASSLILWSHAESAVDELSFTNDQLTKTLAISTAAKLAMQARVQVDDEPISALLLAVEAVEQTERQGYGVLPEAADSLQALLQNVGGNDISTLGIPDKTPPEGYIARGWSREKSALYSANSRYLLNMSHGNPFLEEVEVAIFDLDLAGTSTPLKRWKLWDKMRLGAGVCWVPEKNRLVAVGDGGQLKVWNSKLEKPEVVTARSLQIDGYTIGSSYLSARHNESLVRGVVIYDDIDGGRAKFGSFSVDLNTDEVKVNTVLDGDPAWTERTSFRVAPDLAWLVGDGPDKLSLLKLDRDGSIAESGYINIEGHAQNVEIDASGRLMLLGREHEGPLVVDLSGGTVDSALASARPVFRESSYSQACGISPTEPLVAIASIGSEIRVVDLTGQRPTCIVRLPYDKPLVVKFSPDGKWLAVGGIDRVVRVWSVPGLYQSLPPLEFRGMSTVTIDVTFSPDGRHLVAEGLESTFRRWDFGGSDGGAQPTRLGTQMSKIVDTATSPGGKWLGVASKEPGQLKVIGIEGEGELVWDAHGDGATGVAFSRDGKWVASSGLDGFARVWAMAEIEEAITKRAKVPPARFEFDISHERLELKRRLDFHPRGTLYLGSGDGSLYEWDLTSEDPVATQKVYPVHSRKYLLPDVTVSPDGKLLAIARHGWDGEPLEGETQFWNQVMLFDVSQPGPPVPVAELQANFHDTTTVAFSPDNRWLAAGGSGLGATVWDLEAEDIPASLVESEFVAQRTAGLAFSPDGGNLAVVASDGRIHLWDWKNRTMKRTIVTGTWLSVANWIDATRLATAGVSGELEVWETDVGELKNLARNAAGRDLKDTERVRFRISKSVIGSR